MNINIKMASKQDMFREKLANWLGITFAELEEFGEDIEANHENNGTGDYDYFIQFSDSTSQDIIDKMIRIDDTNTVYFNLEELYI